MPLPFIHDGQTIPSYIPNNDDLYDEFTYFFRHATQEQVCSLVERQRGLPVKEQLKIKQQFVADHLDSWTLGPEPEHPSEKIRNLKSQDGCLEINLESVSVLFISVLDEMAEVISGNRAPIDPKTKRRAYPLTREELEKN